MYKFDIHVLLQRIVFIIVIGICSIYSIIFFKFCDE
jgi:uncharacterized membrane protein YuzA (DUF378 family)